MPHTPRSKGSVSSPGTLYCASHTKVKGKCVRSWDTVLCLTHQGQRELVKSWDTVLCLTHQGQREVCQVLGHCIVPHTPRSKGSVSGPGTLYCASHTKVKGNLSSPGTLYCASHTKVKGKCVRSWDLICPTHQGYREVCQVLGPDLPHTPRLQGSVSGPGT